jgi:hypothetical protein
LKQLKQLKQNLQILMSAQQTCDLERVKNRENDESLRSDFILGNLISTFAQV